MVTFKDLIKLIREYNPEEEEIITKAYYFAEEHHAGKKRLSGEDYITHPLSVAYMAAKLFKADKAMVIASLFHDLAEDCPEVSIKLITELFGSEIALLVNGVTRNPDFDKGDKQKEQILNEAKMLSLILIDIRIILIKILDRLHNLLTIEALGKEKAKRKAKETLDTYVPMLNALGMNELKQQIEDLALIIYDPEAYEKIKLIINNIREEAEMDLREALESISNALIKEYGENKISFRLEIKTKSIYEIYRKLESGSNIDLLHDLLAIKIMLPSKKDCYIALGIINNLYPPLSHFSKDYIARPKENAYQALHTTAQLPNGGLIQFRIKTFEMEEKSRKGISRYWSIWQKEAFKKMMEALYLDYEVFQRIKDILIINGGEFSEELMGLIHEEVYNNYIRVILLPNIVINIPENSTIADLYFILSKGEYQGIEKFFVNEKEVSWDYKLANDDCIFFIQNENEITTEYLTEILSHTKTQTAKRLAKLPK